MGAGAWIVILPPGGSSGMEVVGRVIIRTASSCGNFLAIICMLNFDLTLHRALCQASRAGRAPRALQMVDHDVFVMCICPFVVQCFFCARQ